MTRALTGRRPVRPAADRDFEILSEEIIILYEMMFLRECRF